MNLSQAMNSKYGPIVISVLLGLGLAAMFRRVCRGDGCVVVKAPDLKEVQDSVYRYGDACYKYTPHATPCQWRPRAPNQPRPSP